MDYDAMKKVCEDKKKCRVAHENELTKVRSDLNQTRFFLIDERRSLGRLFLQEMNVTRTRINTEKKINQTEVMLHKRELFVSRVESQLKNINAEIASLETSLTKLKKDKNAKRFKFFNVDKSKKDGVDKSACKSPSFSYSNPGYSEDSYKLRNP